MVTLRVKHKDLMTPTILKAGSFSIEGGVLILKKRLNHMALPEIVAMYKLSSADYVEVIRE